MRVEDAQGAAPSIPFWLGEAPGRTPELSAAVAELRLAGATRLQEGTVDKREQHPSRRSPKKGPPQGERKLSFENNNRTARPEEPPPEERSVSKGSGGVSKHALSYAEGGARWRRSTLSEADWFSGSPLQWTFSNSAGEFHSPAMAPDHYYIAER